MRRRPRTPRRPSDASVILVEPRPEPGWRNMALDRALLDQAGLEHTCYLRLYRWRPHCLSFGRHEPAARRFDRDRLERDGIAVVRRPTGGRAVWHAHEVTYAVAAPSSAFGSRDEAYHTIHDILATALGALGASASLAPRPSRVARLEAGPCFAEPVGGEVLVGGRKVVGSAQYRRGAVFLQHGSILIEDTQDVLRNWLRSPAVPRGASGSPWMPLERRVGFRELCDAIVAEFTRRRGPGVALETGDQRRLRRAAARYEARFRDDTWTWRR